MSTLKLVIPPAAAELPICIPNLMPFHIDYTGPAPVSTFMRVEKVKPEDVAELKEETTTVMVAPPPGDEDVQMKPDASTTGTPAQVSETTDVEMKASLTVTSSAETESQTLSVTTTTESTLVVESQTALSSESTQVSTPPLLEDADRRFVSTFRGRSIHGLTIDLPAGYGGLILQTEGDDKPKGGGEEDAKAKIGKPKAKAGKGKEKEKAGAKSRGRLTRSAALLSKPQVIAVDDDEEMEDSTSAAAPDAGHDDVQGEDTHDAQIEDDYPVRRLIPKAQFSSFTLWHADRPVDKGRDEYYRTLTEWVALAHEIHRTDL
ncbi:ribonuclease H2, subunit C [Flammula alnicola]|nr:ribonuclease H2, subunit C [Flammula alnicola]